ncbi:esterase/lipase family protein [Streptomyces sp. NPDC020983]|uniref:esterase/lipase family protein n=1 Tax=Streptomyces sp. NPDC020983 TaxID=3365106 RepID=UPI0037ADAEFD
MAGQSSSRSSGSGTSGASGGEPDGGSAEAGPTGAGPTGAGPAAERDAEAEAATAAGRLWHSVGLARATAADLAVLARHLVLYPTGMFPEHEHLEARESGRADAHGRARAAAAARTRPPVLLLHGFVDNRSAFSVLRRSLHEHGWPQVQALNYSPLIGDIRTAAEMLGRHVEEVCARSHRRRVDIVGHSLGGLIARYYVQRLGGDHRVRTLVTLGTPHAGTRAVPVLAPHPIIRQLRPGSGVLQELAAPSPGCRTRFVAFWSDLDQLMIPVEAARLVHPDLPAENVQVSGVGHLALPVHGTVVTEIRRALLGAGPLRPAIEAA